MIARTITSLLREWGILGFTPFSIKFSNYRSLTVPVEFKLEPGIIGLVGPNNGGKSNVLRFFYELRPLFRILQNPPNTGPSLISLLTAPNANSMSGHHPFSGVEDPDAIFSAYNDGPLTIEVSATGAPPFGRNNRMVSAPASVFITINRPEFVTVSLRHGTNIVSGKFEREQDAVVFSDSARGVSFDLKPYIDAFSILSDTTYIGSFRNVINQGAREDYFDLVIGNALIQRWSTYQGGKSRRDKIAAIQVVKELERIFGFSQLELRANADKTNIDAIVDSRPFALSELGSGVSQFFITMVNLELNQRRMVLIDEPELGLHPQLQNDFLLSIADRASTVLFTTHSLGLARNMANSVYTVSRSGPYGSSVFRRFESIHNPTELLGELSYAGNYDLGFRKILLVEGPSEVRLFRILLQKINPAHGITIVSLGGSSSINAKAAHALIEIRRLSEKVYAIVDSERPSADTRAIPERLQFKRNCERIGICCHLLELRSTEAYFTDEAIKAAIGERYSSLDDYEKTPDDWPKNDNWRIADATPTLSDFRRPDLVDFLKHIVAD
jgi:hypothetical protein